MAEELVEVHITATETVRYSVRKKIPKSVYDRYCALVDQEEISDRDLEEQLGDLAERLLDPLYDDPDSDGYEDLDIKLVKPK